MPDLTILLEAAAAYAALAVAPFWLGVCLRRKRFSPVPWLGAAITLALAVVLEEPLVMWVGAYAALAASCLWLGVCVRRKRFSHVHSLVAAMVLALALVLEEPLVLLVVVIDGLTWFFLGRGAEPRPRPACPAAEE